jgi:membrane protease YdiL (CAAX protease family)
MQSSSSTLDAAPRAVQVEISTVEVRRRWFELFLVLFVSCGTPLLHSLYLLIKGPGVLPQISEMRWLAGLVQEVSSLLLLGYVLARRSRGIRDLGLRWSFRDVGVGLLVAGASFAAYMLGVLVVQLIHYTIYRTFATGPTGATFFSHPGPWAVPFMLLNPFFEELIVRAYLMTEVADLTGSSALAVAASVLFQSSYHLYYGWAGASSIAFMFLALSLYYVRSRRALPIIVAHAFFDIYALIRLW